MKVERDHGDNFYLPADDNTPFDETQVHRKDTEYVQARRGVIDYPADGLEYYSKFTYDFLDELRGQLPASGVNTVVNIGRLTKVVWIFCPTGSASPVFVNFQGGDAANAAGSLQVLAGQERGPFYVSVKQIKISSNGAGIADFRLTWGY